MLQNELMSALFEGGPHDLAEPMANWLASSRRFTAFVAASQPKIRKKLRSAREAEGLRDLQLELETAYLLLREQSLTLVYELKQPQPGRSPDFAVTFTTSLTFMVEVTRLRAAQPRTTKTALAVPLPGDRFADTVCSKLGQLLPQRSNLLLVGVEGARLTEGELQSAMLRIQQRAEGNDPAVVQRQGFRDRADFFRHYHRLSAMLVRSIPLLSGEPVAVWVNPQAKHPLPTRVRTAVIRSHTL